MTTAQTTPSTDPQALLAAVLKSNEKTGNPLLKKIV